MDVASLLISEEPRRMITSDRLVDSKIKRIPPSNLPGQEYDGSDSGARPDEAVSWGKIKLDASPVKVSAFTARRSRPRLALPESTATISSCCMF